MKVKNLPINTVYAYLAILLAIAIWGGAVAVIKFTVEDIPPFTFLFLRYLLVCVVMLPVAFFELKKTPINPKDYKTVVLLGIMGQSAIALIFWGLKYAGALDTAIIGTVAPILVIVAGHYYFKDEVNSAVKVGIAIAMIGTLVIVLEPLFAADTSQTATLHRLFGNSLVVLYNVSFAIYVIWSKASMGERSKDLVKTLRAVHIRPVTKAYSPVLLTTLSFYVGLVTMFPFMLLELKGTFGVYTFNIASLTPEDLVGLLYMAILSSIVAYIAYEWGLRGVEASDTAIFGYLGPLFTLPAAYFLLGELPTQAMLVGTLIIMAGVFIAEKYKHAGVATKKDL